MKTADYILIDWGTSRFRLRAIQANMFIANYSDDKGMGSLQPDAFEPHVDNVLKKLGLDTRAPVFICGMAGAASGWQDAGYIDITADLSDLLTQLQTIEETKKSVFIVPGIAQRSKTKPDVMRGEETTLLGLILSGSKTSQVCIPGTHSKWVELENGSVSSFATFATGECFAAFHRIPTLQAFLKNKKIDQESFLNGVRASFEAPEKFLNLVFQMRSANLLQIGQAKAAPYSYLSGLVIGLEIAGQTIGSETEITLLSNGELGHLYALAFEALSMKYVIGDADALTFDALHYIAKETIEGTFK